MVNRLQMGLSAALVGVAIVVVQPQVVRAISASEVAKTAKEITVLIESPSGVGSGVLLKRSGQVYTVATAQHVLASAGQYTIVTPDGKSYSISQEAFKELPGVDLAMFEFKSTETYSVAKIGDSSKTPEGTPAYISGFPATGLALTESIYNFTEGKITANANRPLQDGYALVYSNATLPGMSGGPVLNSQGELIGIHGRAAEANVQQSSINADVGILKTEFNLGIPINTFLRLAPQIDASLALKTPPPLPTTAQPEKAADFYLQGGDQAKKENFDAAIANFDKALALNPNYAEAYNSRGEARSRLRDYEGAIKDYNQAITLDPKLAIAYSNRGASYHRSGKYKEAIKDYGQSIALDPDFTAVYSNRGAAYHKLGKKEEAINDYNKSIALDPKFPVVYNNRGAARSALGDKAGAMKDFNQAIKLDPNCAPCYQNRGVDRSYLNDKQGAVADLQKAADLFLEQNDMAGYKRALKNIKRVQ